MSHLKPESRIYKLTPTGLVTEIIEIIRVDKNFGYSKKRKFHRYYGSGNVKEVGNEEETGCTSYKIESVGLKEQWQKQIVVSQIMQGLDTDLELRVLENILELIKYKS